MQEDWEIVQQYSQEEAIGWASNEIARGNYKRNS
jgi:hypothetical protein